MADSEKSTNPDVKNTNNIATSETSWIDLSKLPQEEPRIGTENTPENIESPETENSNKSWTENLETTLSSESSSEENLSTNLSTQETTTQNSLNENPNLEPKETINDTNNPNLWESNMPTNTVNEPGINPNSEILQNQLLEHPVVLNNVNLNPEEWEKTKLSQKEKLTQLIKTHESKAQKSWFIRWFLSGVALIAILVFASFILAKDQILNFLNDWNTNNQTLSASIVNLSEDETNNNEDISNTEEKIENNEDQVYDEDSFKYKWSTYYEPEEESYEMALPYEEYEEIENEEIGTEEIETEEIETEEINNNDENIENEISEDTEPTDKINEDKSTENSETDDNELDKNTQDYETEKSYTITPVSSEETANWVMPAHCSDLTCYGEGKEFTPCKTFRLSENLDENTNRIWKNWVCRYKDASELVFVEFEQ